MQLTLSPLLLLFELGSHCVYVLLQLKAGGVPLLKRGPHTFKLHALELELTLRILEGSAQLLSLIGLLDDLRDLDLCLFEILVISIELGLRLNKGGILQRELGLRLFTCGALLLELSLGNL